MARSTAVEETAPPAVPALRQSAALDLDAGDIRLPRIYLGQPNSAMTQEGRVKAYSISAAVGADDPAPINLAPPGDEKGVLIHVLAVKRGLYRNLPGQDLETWDYGDPAAPVDARVSYDYTVALPEVEELADVPVKLMLKGASQGAAKQLNYQLLHHSPKPPYELAFRLTVVKRENDKGRFSVAKVEQVPAEEYAVKAAEQLASLAAQQPAPPSTTTQEPSI